MPSATAIAKIRRSICKASVVLYVLAMIPASFAVSAYGQETPVSATHYQDNVRPVLMKYCGECHAPDDEEDEVRFLRSMTADEVAGNRGVWASVAEQLHNRTMPPADEPQPSEEERRELSAWVWSHLKSTACDQGSFAGTPIPRRLNRDQYTYAIKDLTGVDFDFVETFPADGSGGEGFDNNGETLFLPPLLMERYMEVAQQVVDHVIVAEPFDVTYVSMAKDSGGVQLVSESESSETDRGNLQPGQSVTVDFTVSTEADFGLAIKAVHDSDDRENLELLVDGIVIKTVPISRNKNATEKWLPLRPSRGVHQITIKVPDDSAAMEIRWMRLNEEIGSKSDRGKRQAATERIFAAGDDLADDLISKRLGAQKIVSAFARKAWRRGVNETEIVNLMKLYDRGIQRGESMTQAIKLPLKAILVSPKFLFVVESTEKSTEIKRITDLELATRLSLFLWHSLPDEELLALAAENGLRKSKMLHAQVRRMLADDRSKRFAKAFSGQWLGTVAVGRTVIPDTNHFKPVYTSELVEDLGRQVTETMAYVMKADRPLTDWLSCDYVVVNKRLAKHYALKTVPKSDSKFEVVRVQDSPRGGVLGLGAVHMLTSYSRRTSPVLRGGWVLETVFGVHLPSPPPDAGALPGGEKESSKKTVRQRLQDHRKNPTCAACHNLIDPIGFAMENFDVLGRWRDKEGKRKIDSNGKLPSGEEFAGPRELQQVLMNRQDEFLHQISQRMLGYALGRSLEDADQCTVGQLAERLQKNDAKVSELILGIVESTPFQNRQGSPK